MVRSSRLLTFGLPLLILALAAAFALFLKATKPQVAAKPATETVWPVSVMPVQLGDRRPVVILEGQVAAARIAELRPLVAGPIVAVAPNFREAGQVAAGEMLVAVDAFNYEAALREREAEIAENRARIAELEADLEVDRRQLVRDEEQNALSQAELKRREALRRAGTISDKALDDARIVASERQQRVLARQQSIARTTARLEQAKAAGERLSSALDRAGRSLADTKLTAPFAGFAYDVDAAIGKQVGGNDRLGRLVDASSLEVRFHAPDEVFGQLLKGGGLIGSPAEVVWRVGSESYRFAARIDRIGTRIEAASGGVDLYAALPGINVETPLRPGAFVTVELAGPVYRQVAKLPLRSLHENSRVYVVKESRLEAREVELVARDQSDVLLRGQLADGDPVVLTRFPEIGPGLKVALP